MEPPNITAAVKRLLELALKKYAELTPEERREFDKIKRTLVAYEHQAQRVH